MYQYITRNTLTQASKNGRKPYLFPQKTFVSTFYAINIFNTIYYFKPTNFNCVYRKCLLIITHFFSVLFTMFLVYNDLKQKIEYDELMTRSMHLHTEIYPNLNSISELLKMYMKSIDSFILAPCDNCASCNIRLSPP